MAFGGKASALEFSFHAGKTKPECIDHSGHNAAPILMVTPSSERMQRISSEIRHF